MCLLLDIQGIALPLERVAEKQTLPTHSACAKPGNKEVKLPWGCICIAAFKPSFSSVLKNGDAVMEISLPYFWVGYI